MTKYRNSVAMRQQARKIGLALLLTLPAMALADKRCYLEGSWYGSIPPNDQNILLTHHSGTESQGTSDLEIPGFDPTIGGSFPSAVKLSSFRGTWERIDNRTFGVTLIGYSVDFYGDTVVIGKIRAIETLSSDCNSMLVRNVNEVFLPGQDPFEDTPFFSYEAPLHSLYRMRMDLPEFSSD